MAEGRIPRDCVDWLPHPSHEGRFGIACTRDMLLVAASGVRSPSGKARGVASRFRRQGPDEPKRDPPDRNREDRDHHAAALPRRQPRRAGAARLRLSLVLRANRTTPASPPTPSIRRRATPSAPPSERTARLTSVAMRARLRAAAAAELSGGATAIFCSEHCHSRLTSPSEVDTLRDFLGGFFDDVRVGVYLRRQDQVALSLYSTRLKSGDVEHRDPAPR